MKDSILAATVAIAVGTALVTSTVAAVPIGDLRAEVASLTGGNGQVNVAVYGTSVTLSGYVDDAGTANAVSRAVLKHDDIDRVYDLISRD